MHKAAKAYSRKNIAQILTISEKRVKQLTDEGVIDEFSPGFYHLLPAVRGYIGYLQSLVADDDQSSDYNQERARYTRIKREDAELDLQVKRNELHHAHVVEFVVTNSIVAFKAKLETLPHTALPALMGIADGADKPERILAVLKKSTDDALSEFAEYDPADFSASGYAPGAAKAKEDVGVV